MQTSFYRNKVAVITGGTSGIGYAIAREMLAKGSRVYLIGRDAQRMHDALRPLQKAFSTARVSGVLADVSDAGAIERAIQTIGEEAGAIDFLINSAGIMVCGMFVDIEPADYDALNNINYLGCVNATRAAWPYLLASRGHIGMISSVAGYTGVIGYTAYAAAKFAMTGFAEALRMEAELQGITISVLYPPDTDTPMLHYEHQHAPPESRALNQQMNVYAPKNVARIYVEGIQKGRQDIYCDIQSRLLRWVKTLFPGIFHKQAMKIIQKARRQRRYSEADH